MSLIISSIYSINFFKNYIIIFISDIFRRFANFIVIQCLLMHKQRISCSLNAISRTNNVKYLCTISTEAGKYGVQEKLASETTGRKSYVGFLASLLDNDVNRYCNT